MYKTFDGRVLLKCTTGLVYDSAGAMRYTLGKLTDLTGLTSFQHFGYEYEGPNKEKFYQMYKLGLDHECILTKREKEILYLLREGFTSRVIASKLFISVHTVDTHRRNIIEKMETKTALEAYRKCKNAGWL
ncbi:MAG TPA: helix-turn-helix transcriptional regulator [Gillisia sp.]|nr:helix-turn-helix transcriptional regulator [Gillisia sp.]